MNNIILIDLSSILHPLYHKSGSEPHPDWVAQQTIAKIHSLVRGSSAAICCDSPNSERKKRDPTYKANRPERDERLVHQCTTAKLKLIEDGLEVWEHDGWEADDVIASAVAKL